jgi:hypothetical protein
MKKKMLSNLGQIKCQRCHNPILEYDIETLSSVSGNQVINASMFRSIISGWADPKPHDVMSCPICGNNYIEALQDAWQIERIELREWDK